ncbi:putative Defective in cullin neddylation protein 1 [Blattamonas nauphoetae]|uniref:Defective in cullin neddylation protein n=1 Tax=Blattamonas nauphoetae TaxID=2049346 RepID=A0ABQ9YHQ9_9EUKA|nr:putative Defective in cullin neddylation protein 1 [Blattamonas nauphoetae]
MSWSSAGEKYKNNAKQQVASVTGCSMEVAERVLQHTQGDITSAINEYYDHPERYPEPRPKTPPKPKVNEGEILNLFKRYSNSDQTNIEPDGLERLLDESKVDPENIGVLIFAWKAKAEHPAEFSKDEFVLACKETGIDTLNAFGQKVPTLISFIQTPAAFRDFYRWSFKYYLTEERARKLSNETACILFGIVMKGRTPFYDQIIQFLTEKKDEVKTVSIDAWNMLLDFGEQIQPDLSNYDIPGKTDHWPVMIDDFVDWIKSKQ